MYHIAKKYHPLYLEKMQEVSDELTFDKGGKYKTTFNNLISVIKCCQQKYGGKTELATEQDEIIVNLCDAWEEAISYGIKSPQLTVLQNVQEIVSGQTNEPNFWEFSLRHLTSHERERFENLKNVWTARGKTKALIRAALNERSLERYVLMWLHDPNLSNTFEPWSLMLNKESSSILPSLAAGLSSILFAVAVDSPDINITKQGIKKSEPVVFTPAPVGPSKKTNAIQREIVSLEENKFSHNQTNVNVAQTFSEIEEFCEDVKDKNIEMIAGSQDSAVDVLEHFEISKKRRSSSCSNTKSEDENLNDNSQLAVNNTSFVMEVSSESSYFSRQSSTGSVSIKTDVNELEQQLKEITERCSLLEARVAELSLENRRLHRLMNHSGNENWQFLVSIPRSLLMKSGTKNYYAYEINVNFTNNLDEWIVVRRYSEFYKLHQKSKKNNVMVKALDFPPKKKIGNMDVAFVEERRQRLQIYLRHLLAILPEVSTCMTKTQLQAAFPFLKP